MPNITLDQVDNLRIASPCSMSWDDMDGDDLVRHCSACSLNVYDFSRLTREQIVELLNTNDERVCGQLYRRADGTVLTRDCPVGLAKLRRRTATMLLRVAAAVGMLVTSAMVLGQSSENQKEAARLRVVQPFAKLANAIDPQAPAVAPIRGGLALGRMVCPQPLPPQIQGGR